MIKIKEGFKGERSISLPEELLTQYSKDPLIGNLYVRKIGFFPKVKYHFVQKDKGCNYSMLIYCTDGKGWYRIKGKEYRIEQTSTSSSRPTNPMLSGPTRKIRGLSTGSISGER
jgi:hypothetical protein